MKDLHAFTERISGSIQAAKSSAASMELAQPEFFRTMLRIHIEHIPDEWQSKAKAYNATHERAALEELSARLNEDIQDSLTNSERHYIYQLLLRLLVIVYSIEGGQLRSSGMGMGHGF